MARPRTPIGTFGEIELAAMPNGTARARVRFRDLDGQLRRVEVNAATRKLAEHRLKEKLAQRIDRTAGSGDLTPDSSFTHLVAVWLDDLDLEGKVAPSTRALYERNMRQLVMPAFANYSLREINVRKVDQFIKTTVGAFQSGPRLTTRSGNQTVGQVTLSTKLGAVPNSIVEGSPVRLDAALAISRRSRMNSQSAASAPPASFLIVAVWVAVSNALTSTVTSRALVSV